ncbi:MAG: DMT family transporter [Alphaproteobacteria bacterium]|nr:DMT family transporter [Alphaproteobacteria bacterium]
MPAPHTARTPDPAPRPAHAGNLAGMAWMLGSAAMFSAMTALMKELVAGMPPAVVVLFRSLFFVLVAVPWAMRAGGLHLLRTRAFGQQVKRATYAVASILTLAIALKHLALADTVALAFTRPLWMVVVSVVMLAERVGPRRIGATLFGFLGVLVIVRPGGLAQLLGAAGGAAGAGPFIDPWMLVALSSALLSAINMAHLKILTRTDTPLQVQFWFGLIGAAEMLPLALLEWVHPTWRDMLVLLGASIAGTGGNYCVIRATAAGDTTAIAPLDFCQLPIAALIGLAFFAEVPDLLTLAGSAIILAAVLYMARREARPRPGAASGRRD